MSQKKVALVTGGTGGIGSAISKRLATDNHVIACYFKQGYHEKAHQWRQEQRSLGYDVDVLYADLINFNDCIDLVKQIQMQYGRIDILVNNAGVTADSRLKKMSEEQWHYVMDSNLTTVFNITRNVLPMMIEQGYGRIINISSINGHKGQVGQCNYSATKAALLGFTKSLALEVATHGITVNTISPGYIKTPMLDTVKPEILDSIINQIPIGRLGKAEEIASTVAFLSSVDAGFITGSNINVNGGQYM